MHLAAHLARQANDVIVSVKNKSNKPVIIAPIMLVAANSIAKSIAEVRAVPKIPVKSAGSTRQTQHFVLKLLTIATVVGVKARKAIATAKSANKNVGVMVIIAAKRKNAATMPITMLATTAIKVQSVL